MAASQQGRLDKMRRALSNFRLYFRILINGIPVDMKGEVCRAGGGGHPCTAAQDSLTDESVSSDFLTCIMCIRAVSNDLRFCADAGRLGDVDGGNPQVEVMIPLHSMRSSEEDRVPRQKRPCVASYSPFHGCQLLRLLRRNSERSQGERRNGHVEGHRANRETFFLLITDSCARDTRSVNGGSQPPWLLPGPWLLQDRPEGTGWSDTRARPSCWRFLPYVQNITSMGQGSTGIQILYT